VVYFCERVVVYVLSLSLSDTLQANTPTGLSALEKIRLESVRQVQARMEAIGLPSLVEAVVDAPRRRARRPSRKHTRPRPKPAPREPSRRSSRLRALPAIAVAAAADAAGEEEEEEEEEEMEFEDSALTTFLCSDDTASATPISDEPSPVDGRLSSVRLLPGSFREQHMKRIYSLHLATWGERRLLAGCGHGGWVGVWGVGDACEEDQEPLLAWRAHGGWVSGVRFIDRYAECSCVHG
jgi:hypothetical protein